MKTRSTALLALALMAVLPGCDLLRTTATTAEPATGPQSEEGIARLCTPSPVDLSSANATATITMSGEGGWCAERVTERDGQPFATGLVRVRPVHGRIYIENAGGRTRVEYFPEGGYIGADTFTVALRSHVAGAPDATLKVNVTVSRPG